MIPRQPIRRATHHASARRRAALAWMRSSRLPPVLMRPFGRAPPQAPWDNEKSIREELFSVERLEQHAESLAAAQSIAPRNTPGRSLKARLRNNERALLDAYRAIAAAVDGGRAITPAAEWLLDNYHLVEEQIREIRDDLPPGYYRQLPKLASGPFAGYPRVFGIAWAFVAHTDSRFDPEMLRRYARAYQRVEPLTIGELWAVAITLRIVLVENLRRAARRIVMSRAGREAADALADRLLDGPEDGEAVGDLLRTYDRAPLQDAFAVQFVHRLRDQDPRVTPALTWLEGRLAAQGTTAEEMVRDEHQRQGAANVTVRNIVTSMRLVSDIDWAELVEGISLVDDVLRAESAFASMDLPTRNLYRSAVEELARGSALTELEIARAALAASGGREGRQHDPGWHLVAGGRAAFEAAVGFRPPASSWLARFNARIGIGGYIAAVALVAAALLALPIVALAHAEVDFAWIALLALLGLVPAIDAATALVNRGVTRGFGATILPGLELEEGVPAHLRTLVAVPMLLTTADAIDEQIERLEVLHLASDDGELHFALLADWTDALTETVAGDDALAALAAAGIARLNARHAPVSGGARFLLLHRRRVWNEGQARWIGWERKRGKLHELNRLLRGATDTTYVDPVAMPAGVRYVVTLDADTRVPRETVRRLVGKMAHPLNQPRFDAAAGRVVEGHGLLQPRVTPSLPVGREGSVFQRIYSSMNGIDPYAAAVSDVYQDLFGEGSYTGKGIYDVDAFEAALAGRVPESTMLSHDLFEGICARAGLASDIEVVEEFPARYDVAAARQHRWVRGDWQLWPWIFGRREGGAAPGRAAALPLIGRWKMIDNLRRSLSAPASVAALIAGWTLPLREALLWTGLIVATIMLATLLPVLSAIYPRHARVTAGSHFRALAADVALALSLAGLIVTFLAHQASLMTDAIARTLFRLVVTRRHLLDWTTAAQATIGPRLDLAGFYRQMSGGVLIAIAGIAVLAWSGGGAWPAALPFLFAWLASPAIARRISLSPAVAGRIVVSADDADALRMIARRTWRYFETFVTAADNMLPPDNFQEDPHPVVAHRTSPTNIGLYLVAAVSARDFGWAGTADTVARLEATLATMQGLARFRGHFYNWYDTRDLRPLDPPYVSSVDSGNLAGHLIAIANACREWRGRMETAGPERRAGLDDELRLLREALQALPDDRRTQTITRGPLDHALDGLGVTLRAMAADPGRALEALAEQAANMVDIARTLASERGDAPGAELRFWAESFERTVASHRRDLAVDAAAAAAIDERLAAVEANARAMANAMEFGFLLDPARRLLSIGYRVADGTLDPSCYDLLASEARLASFVAIAKGDVAARHWFRLGRTVTPVGRGAALISWSGSMFEYLMPALVMRAPAGSLLAETSRLVVRRQQGYAATLDVPWGISESAYNVRDLELTYQYSNFGVPGLGLKRGLGESAVIAPYATALAAMVDTAAAARNFARLAAVGALGRYGFYEALDYTPARLPEGESVAIVRAFMAHHQGMSIVAIANGLLDGVMRARFHAEPSVQATELLLQERTPRDVAIAHPRAEEVEAAATVADLALPAMRILHSPHDATPQVHLLSNGRYAVMVTAAGSGYSRWGDVAITRWREDVTRDDWGSYIYLRDVQSGEVWSAGHQPTGAAPDRFEAVFTEDRAEFVRHDGTLTTRLEIVVSPEDQAEVRRVTVTNAGSRARDIELTSYAELALAPPAADTAHPAFSKLFVQTERFGRDGTLVATRRRRSPDEPEIWVGHLAVVEGDAIGEPEVETDRARFLGRGHDARAPVSIMDGRPLSGTVGTVLDPVFALRHRVNIPPGRMVHVAYWTVVAGTRAALVDLIDKHRDPIAFDRATTLAWTQAQVQLSHLGVDAEQAGLFQRLAGHVLFADPWLRPPSEAIRRDGGGPAGLWAQGISGDVPIVLVRVDSVDGTALVRQLLMAHEYWRMKQLAVDLVILNDRASSYIQDLQIALETLVRTSRSSVQPGAAPARGAVFVLRADLIPQGTRALLLSVARAVLVGRNGTLSEQLDRPSVAVAPRVRAPSLARVPPAEAVPRPPGVDLEFFNGLGGFAHGGREYVTVLDPGRAIPAPWINVVANPRFGFQVSVEGASATWSLNSRENQITPWSNDPVSDRSGEVLFLRDEDSGLLWTPTAHPIRDESARYVARHGQGYSRFTHAAHGIALDLLQFVPLDASVKVSRLTLRNLSSRTRRLSLTAYVEWVLGPARAAAAFSLVTEMDGETGAMFARNPWNAAFPGRIAFADLCGRQSAWTGDRREFIGRNGTLADPAGLAADHTLSRRVGAGLDPCGALQTTVELKPGAAIELAFLLGEAGSADDARALVKRYRTVDLDASLRTVIAHWDDVLGTVEVRTPDRAMDLMMNRWLLYQTLACRVWARSAFYQASGAYGFRDQLQDGMALALTRPAITRAHLLRAAARQFVEGDVQHWWLPPAGPGVRTRISDDRVWLGYAVAQYVAATGDGAVLNEPVPFLEGRQLASGEHDAFYRPMTTEHTAALYEHCALGLDASLAVGVHGLPLIGTGDWNDGMNRVGEHGRGESVWLGWFLHATLAAFAPLARARGEAGRAAHWLAHAGQLREALERDGWDGDWYRRGYFDDGTPLGSSASDECRIDSIAQSWSVISGAADPDRARRAMAAVDEHLDRNEAGLALLFTPPFDHTALDPGYVRGYPPGIRENGGQYTHAAAWAVIAFAALGHGDEAGALFARLNPINRTATRADVQRYKVEPYVVAADVYAVAPHAGRGGWTWYTGSAGWLYRAGL
jgi:cyclic beta-1,2-glucan synthetase